MPLMVYNSIVNAIADDPDTAAIQVGGEENIAPAAEETPAEEAVPVEAEAPAEEAPATEE